jgi:preprotein translocase subunit SecG
MVLFILCAVFMILLILIQKGRGGGLAGAFGGGGSGQSAFGTKTADVLTKITAGAALVFFLISVVMAIMLNPSTSSDAQSVAPNEEQKQPAESEKGQTETPSSTGGSSSTPADTSSSSGDSAAKTTSETPAKGGSSE